MSIAKMSLYSIFLYWVKRYYNKRLLAKVTQNKILLGTSLFKNKTRLLAREFMKGRFVDN